MLYLKPILTKHILTVQINTWILSATDVELDIKPFHCHNQAVEHVVQIVSIESLWSTINMMATFAFY